MSGPSLKPCPNPRCKDPKRVRRSAYPTFRVCCEGCGMEGPMALVKRTKAEAARLWNDLPRKEDE